MSIYLDEKNPSKHKPFEDASADIVEYVRYLEVIAGKSANTAFSYYCDLRGFSRFMKRRRGLVAEDAELKEIDPKGLDTAFWGSVTKEDVYEYLYFLNRECGNKKSSTARRLASLHGFYDYLVNQVNRLSQDPTASIKPPKQDKVLPKYLTAEQSMQLLESDKMLPYRILRAAKNRYGSTNELGMFDMTGQGLEEIENPSQMLLEGRPLGVSGNCVACTMEGSRPILSEIQALATKTNFPAPRRACSGYDYNRMNLLIAVLEKRAGYFFGNLDVYINIVSGITLRDTACDLAVCLSMVSSLLDCPVSDKLIAIGEVGLGGEVRSVPNLEQRLREAERIGFERAVVPKHSLAHLNPADYPGMKLIGAAYISDAINALKTDRL